MTRDGYAIHLRGGRDFWPLDARPDDVDIDDITHALSNLCRYNGHTERFYSVAQHAFIASYRVGGDTDQQLRALLHDAAEAYVGDMVFPLKRSPRMQPFLDASDALDEVIATHFDLGTLYNDEIKAVDRSMVYDESASFGPVNPDWENPSHPRPDYLHKIIPLPAPIARWLFGSRYKELTSKPGPETGWFATARHAMRSAVNRAFYKLTAGRLMPTRQREYL